MPSTGKYCLIHLEIVKTLKKGNYNLEIYLKQDIVELDFDVKFPLLCLLQFLSDLKSTIFRFARFLIKF